MNTNPADPRELEALLDFYLASGVDSVLDEQPVDWFARSQQIANQAATATTGSRSAAPPARPAGPVAAAAVPPGPGVVANAGRPPGGPAQPPAIVPDEAAIVSARDLAAAAGSLDDLRACLEKFEGCNLKRTAKSLVFADGNPQAQVMFIGEAPGRDEDLQGKPFVGRSGQLLDRMMAAIGLDRRSAYIANTVPWRPPGNRTPTPQETEICRPFITRQVELVSPEIVIFLGAASAKTLLGTKDGIRKMRGRWMSFPLAGREIAAMATFHPAYLLRNPLEKRLSWRDFLSLKEKLAAR